MQRASNLESRLSAEWHGLNKDGNAAERRQRENALLSRAEIEKRFFEGQLDQLR